MKTSFFLGVVNAGCLTSDFSCLSNRNVPELNMELCKQMPGMTGCSLLNECKGSSEAFCRPQVIYATICQDMPTMRTCNAFKSCNIEKCDLLPSTEQTTKQIYSICNEMTMDGCEKCQLKSTSTYAECDLLSVYSDLCLQMPKMSQCTVYDSMCKNTTSLNFCPSQQNLVQELPPPMQMFFHTGITDYILFENWVPRTTGHYVLAWILVFLSAIFYEAVQVFVIRCEVHWQQQPLKDSKEMINDSIFGESIGNCNQRNFKNLFGLNDGISGLKQSIFRALLRMLSTLIGYTLMLIAMTFNVGLFVAIILGFGTGTLIFAPLVKNRKFSTISPSTECH